MKDFMTIKISFILLVVLLTFSQAFSEKYIGINGPQTQMWWGSLVDMGAENIVHWAGLSVTWRLNSSGASDGLTFDQTKSAVQSSFNAWQDVTTADISFSYGGSTSATWSNDGQNIHYWAEQGDPAFNSGQPLADYNNTLAVTVITFNASEEFLDVDILFNGWKKTWKVDGSDIDIQAVSTHEIGHMLGLHHTEVTSDPKPTMYYAYQGTGERSLEFDDKVGVSFLYRGNLIDNETFSGTDYYNWSLTVSSGKTLTVNAGATINLSGSYKLQVNGNGTLTILGSSGQLVTINGQNYPRTGYSNAMLDIKDGATANIEYANFINSPYDLIIRNSATANVSHCTFSNFGFDSNSRAITTYNSTGTVTISNCTFTGSGQNGYGVYATNTGTNVTISGNTLTSCRVGIRCYASNAFITSNTIQNSYYYGIQSDNVATNVQYCDNTICNNGSYGIYLNSSSPYLMDNSITQNGHNVLINAGWPSFADPEDQWQRGHNTIAHASSPLIKVQNNSSTYMGYGAGGGYNSIYDTDLPQIYATNNSVVFADNNYWGEEGPANAADGTSSVWDRYPLSGNPNPKIDSNDLFAASANRRLIKELNTQDDQEEEMFQKAVDAGFHSDYITSKALLKKIIDKNSSSKYPPLALMMFYHFTQKELQDKNSNRDKNLVDKELAELLDELEHKPKENFLRPFGLKFRAQEAALARDYATLSAYNTRIISEYPNSIHELTSLYDEIAYQLEIEGKPDRAKELLTRMTTAYPEEEMTLLARILIGENVALPKHEGQDQPQPLIEEGLTENRLEPAMPNPFNPSTTISFQLLAETHIHLFVYDEMGREVVRLVDEIKAKGRHSVVLDGSHLTSGIYFLRFEAGGFIKTAKVVLIK